MRRLRAWLIRAAGMFRTGRREREMADEIESHLQLHTDENIRRGLSPEAARRAAVLTLGGVESLKERYREQQGLPSLEHVAQDVKYAARTLRRTPGLTAIAVLTLAIGIAGPTAMFSMIKFWILEPLPFARPDTLVDLRHIDTSTGNYGRINPADFLDWSRSTRTLEELAAYRSDDYRLTGGDRPERAQGASVTPNFFRLIGAHAALGRLFDDEDRKADKTPVTVLSHGLWRERFGADASILGRSVELDGRAHVVVGVLPESFQFTLLGRANVWTPLVFTPEDASNRRPRSIIGLGRLRDGITVDMARAELAGIAATPGHGLPRYQRHARRARAAAGRRNTPAPRHGLPVAGAVRHDRLRPADRVRQRHQRHACPRNCEATRNGRANRARRVPIPDRQAVADRAPHGLRRCRRGRRRAGGLRHGLDHELDPIREPWLPPELRRRHRRSDGAALRARRRRVVRNAVWLADGVDRGEGRCQRRPARRVRPDDDRHQGKPAARRAGGG